MARPQQPELARSAKTDLDPDHVETGLQGQKAPVAGGETGPVPPENQPGHRPPKEQDKPDLDAFAARLGTDPKAPTATNARKGPRKAAAKATTPKSTPAKAAPTKSSPAKSASRPAASSQKAPASGPSTRGPGGPPDKNSEPAPANSPDKSQPAPAELPAAAPAPSMEDTVHFSVPQPEPEGHHETEQHREPLFVGLMLLPLRETVRRLERLDRTLTQYLDPKRRSSGGPES